MPRVVAVGVELLGELDERSSSSTPSGHRREVIAHAAVEQRAVGERERQLARAPSIVHVDDGQSCSGDGLPAKSSRRAHVSPRRGS
ncbi:MAG: hypothetical protein H6835_01910 [Planctomycetes bacterium]|nr:hypothetical protein [Planctomycetota bacterium]